MLQNKHFFYVSEKRFTWNIQILHVQYETSFANVNAYILAHRNCGAYKYKRSEIIVVIATLVKCIPNKIGRTIFISSLNSPSTNNNVREVPCDRIKYRPFREKRKE